MCLACNKRFSGQRRDKIKVSKQLWKDYVFGKQTLKQLSVSYGLDRRSVRYHLRLYKSHQKINHPRPVHLVIDGTYFGERKEGSSWCVIVGRDPEQKEDLIWSFGDTETTYEYVQIRERLEFLGYTILSVTGDGFSGIRSAFHCIPYQMCHVHMERLVIQGTTRNPLTEAGQVLLALVRTLHQNTKKQIFEKRLKLFLETYRDFLNEKTIHPLTNDWSYSHEGVRQAYLSLKRHLPYLFTYKQNTHIHRTTNSLEGHFRHVKKLTHVHHGSSKQKTQSILHSIFLASTISPNKKRLDETL